jgi:hypothetical protein
MRGALHSTCYPNRMRVLGRLFRGVILNLSSVRRVVPANDAGSSATVYFAKGDTMVLSAEDAAAWRKRRINDSNRIDGEDSDLLVFAAGRRYRRLVSHPQREGHLKDKWDWSKSESRF